MKGELSIKAIATTYGKGIKAEKESIQSLDYKYSYIDQQVISKSENDYGFILNNVNLVAYSLPYFAAFFGCFYILFQLTFKHRVSKIFRRFSFVSIAFILMVC